MKFFVWANDVGDPRLAEIQSSARRYRIDIEYIGVGISHFDWSMKADVLLEALSRLDDQEIVCALDGFDVFFQQDAEFIRKRFLLQDCEIVASAERGYSGQYRKYKSYYDRLQGSTPYIYCNAGSIVGYTYALKKLYTTPPHLIPIKAINRHKYFKKKLRKLTTLLVRTRKKTQDLHFDGYYASWHDLSDQTLLGRNIAVNPYNLKIKMDYHTALFWCAAFEWEDIAEHYLIRGGKIVNCHTASVPTIIHVPNEAKYRHVFRQLFDDSLRSSEPPEFFDDKPEKRQHGDKLVTCLPQSQPEGK